MVLIICFNDFNQEQEFIELICNAPEEKNDSSNESLIISSNIINEKTSLLKTPDLQSCKKKHLKKPLDSITYYYFRRELLNFKEFRHFLYYQLALRNVSILNVKIIPTEKNYIDWKWNRMVSYTLWSKIEAEYLMSWLSTLGGGFSALGEQFQKYAEIAGKISKRQLCIGIQLDDPYLQSRCKLYYSISLIQTGHLRRAKYIIREQYKFALAQHEVDGRLLNMCKGIWLRLQYEYGLRFLHHKQVTSMS